VRPASGEIDLPDRLRRHEAIAGERRQPRMDDTLGDTMDREIFAPQPKVINPRLEGG